MVRRGKTHTPWVKFYLYKYFLNSMLLIHIALNSMLHRRIFQLNRTSIKFWLESFWKLCWLDWYPSETCAMTRKLLNARYWSLHKSIINDIEKKWLLSSILLILITVNYMLHSIKSFFWLQSHRILCWLAWYPSETCATTRFLVNA